MSTERPGRQTLQMFGGRAGHAGRLSGSVDGPLRFGRLLGSGGLGEVYEATELSTRP